MKTNLKTLLALSVIALGTLAASPAHAGGAWSVSVSIGAPVYTPPVVAAPPVVYVPPVTYCPPPVVYCPPRVVCPPPVVCAPPGYAYGRWCGSAPRHGWNHGHH